ncbi:hypothetical protein THRCLA_08653 [Thraustotheca clavata]|uniref:Cyclic nucleotide-binding domain-containing protein n=1 Tax=Thraustotheca clavata TaxID=74557 RepID=A0A1V9Z406_9STRA|nr:hypothetical protein THRCLA_08653 [Thraustotheca clavata]
MAWWQTVCCCLPWLEQGQEPVPVDDPEELEEQKRRAMAQSRGRRPSVSSGSLMDIKGYQKKIVPKSEEAIERIKRAVANNFMFNSLDPEQQRDVFDAMEEKRVEKNQIVIKQMYEQLLSGMELMSHLNHSQISVIADALQPANFQPNDIIIQQDDQDYNSFHFYIVMEGQCNFVYTDTNGNSSVVGSVGPHGYFGEKALTEKSMRAVSVIAATNVKCLSMDVATFERLMGPFQEIFTQQITSYCNASELHLEMQNSQIHLRRSIIVIALLLISMVILQVLPTPSIKDTHFTTNIQELSIHIMDYIMENNAVFYKVEVCDEYSGDAITIFRRYRDMYNLRQLLFKDMAYYCHCQNKTCKSFLSELKKCYFPPKSWFQRQQKQHILQQRAIDLSNFLRDVITLARNHPHLCKSNQKIVHAALARFLGLPTLNVIEKEPLLLALNHEPIATRTRSGSVPYTTKRLIL